MHAYIYMEEYMYIYIDRSVYIYEYPSNHFLPLLVFAP